MLFVSLFIIDLVSKNHERGGRPTDPKRGSALGRVTDVVGSIRPTYEMNGDSALGVLDQGWCREPPDYELLQVIAVHEQSRMRE